MPHQKCSNYNAMFKVNVNVCKVVQRGRVGHSRPWQFCCVTDRDWCFGLCTKLFNGHALQNQTVRKLRREQFGCSVTNFQSCPMPIRLCKVVLNLCKQNCVKFVQKWYQLLCKSLVWRTATNAGRPTAASPATRRTIPFKPLLRQEREERVRSKRRKNGTWVCSNVELLRCVAKGF